MRTYKSIAIDGPSGAGKSSMAKAISKRLEFIYVDTGALYRAIGLYILRNNKNSCDQNQVVDLLDFIKIELKYSNREQRILLNDEDVSEDIRLPEVSIAASNVSAMKPVRDFLFNLQRDMAKSSNVIMDGRDIGTVVLPDADIKIFLTASTASRAQRRYLEYKNNGINDINYQDVLDDIVKRDNNDINRKVAPLKKADDAVLVDSTEMNFDQTMEYLYSLIKERLSV